MCCIRLAIIAPILIQVLSSPAAAQEYHPSMLVVGRANPPIGHYDFCRLGRGYCGEREVVEPSPLDERLMALIRKVNREVNKRIRHVSDQEAYGVEEWWTYPEKDAGDVEDVALEKQRVLAEAGVPLSNLLLAVGLIKHGYATALLVVVTDGGDFVLDQATDEVLPWYEVPYLFLKRQQRDHAGRWAKLGDERPIDLDLDSGSSTTMEPI